MRFSVIIPVYNVAPFIRQCLDSIVAAAECCHSEIECVCIDDGSVDSSGSILDAYASSLIPHPSSLLIRIIHQENAGVSAARNLGLREASGDWIVFVDADDVIRDSMFVDLERMLSVYPSIDLAGYAMESIVDENSAPEWPSQSADSCFIDLAAEIGDDFSKKSFCQFAYRREMLSGCEFPPLTVGEDQVFLMAALSRARTCVLSRRKLYGYRFRMSSVTRTEISPSRIGDLLAAQKTMFRLLNESGKRVSRNFVQCRGFAWLEGLPRQLLSLRDETGIGELWNRWFASLRQLAVSVGFDAWQCRWALRLEKSRSILLVRLFLYMSHLRRHRFWRVVLR